MRFIIRKFKKFLLGVQLYRCELKRIDLNRRFRLVDDQIINEIKKRGDKGKVERLQLERKLVFDKQLKLIEHKSILRDKMSKAD